MIDRDVNGVIVPPYLFCSWPSMRFCGGDVDFSFVDHSAASREGGFVLDRSRQAKTQEQTTIIVGAPSPPLSVILLHKDLTHVTSLHLDPSKALGKGERTRTDGLGNGTHATNSNVPCETALLSNTFRTPVLGVAVLRPSFMSSIRWAPPHPPPFMRFPNAVEGRILARHLLDRTALGSGAKDMSKGGVNHVHIHRCPYHRPRPMTMVNCNQPFFSSFMHGSVRHRRMHDKKE